MKHACLKGALTVLLAVAVTASAMAAAQVGQPAPEFTATDIEGKTHKLSDYRGKIVILESYNLDCPFVKNHYKTGAMPDLQAELTGKGVIWLVVNSVPEGNSSYRKPEAAKKEWAEQKIKATAWLNDSSADVGKKYGMRTTPHMFVVDQKGVLAYAGAIDDSPTPSGDPRTARNYVREAVQKLQSGGKIELAQTKPYGCGVKF